MPLPSISHASRTAHIVDMVDDLADLYLAQVADLREFAQATEAGEGGRGGAGTTHSARPCFASLKVERLHGQRFATIRQAKDETLAWLFWDDQSRTCTQPSVRKPDPVRTAVAT